MKTAFLTSLLLAAFASPLAAADAVKDVTLPAYQEFRLANGLLLRLAENHELPLISFNGRIRGGEVAQPTGKEGVADISAELMRKGAGKRSAAEFAEAVDQVGGEISMDADVEGITVEGEFLSRDRTLMIELLGDLLQRPRLPAEEFTKVRQRMIDEIGAAKDADPRRLVPSYFSAFAFASHPYGHETDETSLGAITVEDVKEYYSRQIGADRTILTFVGDFDAKQLGTDLRKVFSGWRRATGMLPSISALPHTSGRRVLLVDKPGATQTYFWIGSVGIARTDPDRIAIDVANTAFGGRFTSMLNSELRIKSGLSYGAGSRMVRLAQPGPLAISSYTRTDSTEKALDLALDVLKRFRTNGLDATTLASVQSYVIGGLPPDLETGSQIAAKLTELAFYGLDVSDVNRYSSTVARLSQDEVMKSIQRVYPTPENVTFVLIGDASKIRDVAKKYGPVTEMKITDKHFAPMATGR